MGFYVDRKRAQLNTSVHSLVVHPLGTSSNPVGHALNMNQVYSHNNVIHSSVSKLL